MSQSSIFYYRSYRQNCRNSRKHWKVKDLVKIMESPRPIDATLHRRLGRSVQAIHCMRSKIRKVVG